MFLRQAVGCREKRGQFEFMSLSDFCAKLRMHINPLMVWALNQTGPTLDMFAKPENMWAIN